MASEQEHPDTAREYLPGYAELSEYIATDAELSLYRRLGAVTARNLLYLQAEVQVLKKRLDNLDELDLADTKSDNFGAKMNAVQPARDWETLVRMAKAGDARQKEKMEIIKDLRSAIADYQEAVLREHKILALNKPSLRVLRTFKKWWSDHRPLLGYGIELLDDESDLMVLYSRPSEDRLLRTVYTMFGYILRKRSADSRIPQSWQGTFYFPASRANLVAAVISYLWTAFLIVWPIWVMNSLKNTLANLSVLTWAVLLFQATISFWTNATRSEIFMATAAYTALLVVFVAASTNQFPVSWNFAGGYDGNTTWGFLTQS